MENRNDKKQAAMDAIGSAIRPIRMELDGVPVTVHTLISGKVEISGNTAVDGAGDAVSGLSACDAEVHPQPSRGVVCAVMAWEDARRLVAGDRLK